MNFFNQYRDLFQVGKIPLIPTQRLRLDNQLFIDRPYIPTYSQQYSLNSKLRQLKKDYNQFESQLHQLEELQDIPKISQSTKKQYYQHSNNINYNKSPTILQNKSRNHYSHKKHQSTIFDHYQQNKSNYIPDKQQLRLQRSLPNQQSQSPHQGLNLTAGKKQKYPQQNQSPFGYYPQKPQQSYEMNQKQNKLQNYRNKSTNQNQINSNQISPQKKLLQQLRKQNEDNTARMIKNQNMLKNKFYQQDTNNILQQSQINHKPSTFDRLEYMPQSTIPKYKIQNSSLQMRQRQSFVNNNNRNFAIRNVSSNNQLKTNNRNKIVPQQKQYNVANKNSSAQQRRKIAKLNIDQRRQKLKLVLKALY